MLKSAIIFGLLVASTAFAAAGTDLNKDALLAANLVRQPDVEKCFKIFEQGGGIPVITGIQHVPEEDTDQYILQGTTRFDNVNAGNWQISVEVSSLSVNGPAYSCKVTKNEE